MASLKWPSLALAFWAGCSPPPPYPSTVLVSGVNASVLAVEGKALYWIDDREVIMSTAASGGPNAPVTAIPMLPLSFWVDTDRIYWGDRGSTIMSVDKQGGSATIIANQQVMPILMTGDANAVYWANQGGCFFTLTDPQCVSYPPTIERYVKQTQQVLHMVTLPDLDFATSLAIDAQHLYWTDGRVLYRVTLDGNTLEQWWDCPIKTGLFIGADGLYGSTGGAITGGAIVRCTTDGAPFANVFRSQDVGVAQLTPSGSRIYFDDNYQGVIRYIATSGGADAELTRDRLTPNNQTSTRPLLADGAWLYWATPTEILRSPLPAN
jgi:hypothetical protein